MTQQPLAFDAIDRALARGTVETRYAEDAERIAKIVRKYWGDEGATVLDLAKQIVEREI